MLEGKRGTHVGMILSVLLFMTFLLFLYSAVEPIIKTKGDKQVLLDSLEVGLIDELSADLTSVTISINNSYNPVEGCIEIAHLDETTGLNSIVRDKDENLINSNSTAGYLKIGWENKRFFKVYYSDEPFDIYSLEGVTCVQPTKDNDYSVGLVKTDKQIFETKIIELKDSYESNYSDIKYNLKIPSDNNFGFDFIYNNGTTIEIGNESSQRGIYIEEVPIQYISNKGDILSGTIKLKIW